MRDAQQTRGLPTFGPFYEMCKKAFRDISVVASVVSATAFLIALFVGRANADPRILTWFAVVLSLSTYELLLTAAPSVHRSKAVAAVILYVGTLICISLICLMLWIMWLVNVTSVLACTALIVCIIVLQNIIHWCEDWPTGRIKLDEGELNDLDPCPEIVSANADEQFSYENEWYACLSNHLASYTAQLEQNIAVQAEAIRELSRGTDLEGAIADEDVRDESHHDRMRNLFLGIEEKVDDPKLARKLRALYREYLLDLEKLALADLRAARLNVLRKTSDRCFGYGSKARSSR